MKILIIGAYPQSIISFRGQLIKDLVRKGHDVTVMTAEADDSVVKDVRELGAKFCSYSVQRNGLNPLADLQTFLQLKKLIKFYQPDKILAYTIKPIIWGGIAAKFIKNVDFFPMITGLGYAFSTDTFKRTVVNFIAKNLYRLALTDAKAVIFQNNDNMNTFVENGLISGQKCHRVYGSGVDIDLFERYPLPNKEITFLLIARLLGDKGIREYAEAAERIKLIYPKVNFELLGPYDSSPDAISETEINNWHHNNIINYLGETKNVLPFIKNCHIFTLPSYHEGLPRTALEAMAVGRPILTTDTSGCRDTVIERKNGFLVPIKDSEALFQKMKWFIEQPESWEKMAVESRKLVCEYFDVKKVNSSILKILNL
ncbi:glycosyltransferase family 4 protein [Colwellia sp. MB02u-14]|uniref:glycosyltransferase family 4 protein n=1 Tax=Colwellia sp. MB02u-14 TaxID=2759815 RepID=UPI0015F631BB|nr:glycosyltransferase family 4 protein [Colwellia sp. MB02u-14]MBA6302266.1 glycosyltransferase family 4 protein [Colwellia sp. MB02u-14]